MKRTNGLDDMLKSSRRARSLKRCLHPSAPAGCGSIIKAHSVSRSSALEAISHNGHVYGQKPNIIEMEKHKGEIQLHRIGIREASTFTGFCDIHDARLFAPIEMHPFSFDRLQIALYGFRAICRELYHKLCAPAFCDSMLEAAAQNENPFGRTLSVNYAKHLQNGFRLGAYDLEEYRDLYGEMLLSSDYSQLGYIAAEFEGPMLLACSGTQAPEFNFKHQRIQTLDDPMILPDELTLSFVPRAAGGYIIITYLSNHIHHIRSLIYQLRTMPDSCLYETLVNYTISCFENFYISPIIYDSLTSASQSGILSKMMEGITKDFDFGTILSLPQCRMIKREQS